MGQPRRANHGEPCFARRYRNVEMLTYRNFRAERGGVPGEVKHFSTQRKINRRDSVSSGERKRNSLNTGNRRNTENSEKSEI